VSSVEDKQKKVEELLKELQIADKEIEELETSANSSTDRNGTWLTSYADLMTLVACFFIMLVAFANFEDPSFQGKAKDFGRFFRGALAINSGEKEDKMVTGSKEEVKRVKPNESETKPKQKKDYSAHIEQLSKVAGVSEIAKPRDIEVIFKGSAMFEPGSVDTTPEVEDSLDVMIDLILERQADFIILFEGHTDDTDISNKVYPSNWELSAARAARVLKKFEKAGIPRERLVAVGYGDSRPVYDNRDQKGQSIPANQKLNRRVVIKVLHDKDAPKENFGLGVFFKGKKLPEKKQKKQEPK